MIKYLWKLEPMAIINNLITNLSKRLNKIILNCPYDFRRKILFHQSPVCPWMSCFIAVLLLSTAEVGAGILSQEPSELNQTLQKREAYVNSLSLLLWRWKMQLWYQTVYPSIKFSSSISLIILIDENVVRQIQSTLHKKIFQLIE